MEEAGVEIIELSDEERAKFVEAAVTVYSDPDVTGAWRDGLYEQVREIVTG